MDISHSDSIRRIMRLRPLAVAVLEKAGGRQCWMRLDDSLSDFCAAIDVDPEKLKERIAALPPVSVDVPWDSRPIYHLVDYLTREHADFREGELPAIAALMEAENLPAYPDGYVVKLLKQEFAYFRQEFTRHMEEEETFLFPKMMRNEACFRFRELGPEVHRGSVNMYLKLENHKPEVEFERMITSIREKLRNQAVYGAAADIAARTQKALNSFSERLFAHAALESNLLFPRAGRLEQELYESSAPGVFRFPGTR